MARCQDLAKLGVLSVILRNDPSPSQVQNVFSILCMFEILGNFKDGGRGLGDYSRGGLVTALTCHICRAIRPHGVLTCLFPETCHSMVNQAWQASDLFTGERTKAWRGGVTSPRPHKVGGSTLTLSCVSGETSKGQGMSREGLPPCKNPSSSICGPLLFLLSIKDTMENIEKHKEENKSHLWFSLSYFLSQLY